MPAEFVCPTCRQRYESAEADGGPCPFCHAIVANQQAITTNPADPPTPEGAIQAGAPSAATDDDFGEYVEPIEGGPWLAFTLALVALGGFIDLMQMFAELNKAAACLVNDGGRQFAQAQHATNSFSVIALVIFVAATIVTFGWFRAAHKNLHNLEITNTSLGPAPTTRAFLTPWRLVVLPYRAVQELWLASHPALKRDPEAWKRRAASWMIRIWWLCFLLRHLRVTINIQPFPADSPVALNLLMWAARVSAAACCLGAVAAVLFIIIVLRVEHRQILRRRRLLEW